MKNILLACLFFGNFAATLKADELLNTAVSETKTDGEQRVKEWQNAKVLNRSATGNTPDILTFMPNSRQ